MPKEKTAAYWAVAAGHEPGIYASKKDCNAQVHGFSGAVWRKFPLTSQGLESAKEFIIAHQSEGLEGPPGRQSGLNEEAGEESSSDSSESSSSSSYEEDPSELFVRVDTNWTLDRDGKKHQYVLQGPPQYMVLFNLDQEDPRNLYGLFTLRRDPTRERCVEFGVMAFLEWTLNPESARYRRGTDPLVQHEEIAVFDAEATRRIIIQQPCASIERRYSGPKPRGLIKGMARHIHARLDTLRRHHGITVDFITVDPDEEKRRLEDS